MSVNNISKIASDKKLCCGCGACASVCPKKAIEMKSDEYGHFYPVVNGSRCIGCSLCERVCCEFEDPPRMLPKTSYAATNLDKKRSSLSSSGGIFPAIAEKILSDGGVVYGTAFSEDFHPEVVAVYDLDELYRLQGSKYVRSDMGDVYRSIEKDLKSERKVLFSGVPCQVAAVKKYLRGNDEGLITIDIVCHGTPSSRMFLDYLEFVQNTRKIKLTKYIFRDKRYGQATTGSFSYVSTKADKNGNIKEKYVKLNSFSSSYYKLFLDCSTFRESCYHCKFSAPERVGDITICDFWGIKDIYPEFVKTVKKAGLVGISGVMVNSEVGEKMIGQIMDDILKIRVDYQDIRKNNPQLNTPSKKTAEHEEVMSVFKTLGYAGVDKYYHKKYRFKIIASTVGQALPDSTKKRLLSIKRKYL